MTTTNRKQQVHDLLKSIETGDSAAVAVVNPIKYIQHNPETHEGGEGLAALFKRLSETSPRVNVVRVFEDGEYVFAHTEYDFSTSKIGFEIFRFEDGLVVEHWDNLQERPGEPNPSGHTMVDGPTEPSDLDKTQDNKALVRAFVDDILVSGRMETLTAYFDGDTYTQHNPQIADGLSGLGAALEEFAKQGIVMKYDHIHRVLGEGNFVLVVSEGSFAGEHTSFYDLFRISDGKIAEHWDTIQNIPPRDRWKNENGKF
jgi:predicted SnoaL-like aldol condensation-catalyzing enzyme